MRKTTNLESPNRTEDITVDEVRNLPTFRDWEEGKIIELIRTLKALSEIMYSNWTKGGKTGRKIAINNGKDTNIAA